MRLMIRAAFFIGSQTSYIFSAVSAIPLPISRGGGEGMCSNYHSSSNSHTYSYPHNNPPSRTYSDQNITAEISRLF